ncbi:MAG: thioredoxin family protein [Sulfuritalea sp.]|nr:thioredoxin family protein [Sulfuritalea sp.]
MQAPSFFHRVNFIAIVAGLALVFSQAATATQSKLLLQSTAQPSAVVQTDQVRAELIAYAPQGIGINQTLTLGLLLQHQPDWHTYWKNPGDSGLATELTWTLPKGMLAGEPQWPTPTRIRIGRLANFGYENTVLLPVPVQVTSGFVASAQGGNVTIRLKAAWLVCRQECIPQEGEFALTLATHKPTTTHAALFNSAIKNRATPLKGEALARLDGNAVVLQIDGLPSGWNGKALNAYPEEAGVFENVATPSSTDTVASRLAPGSQIWAHGTWSALLPLSPQRSEAPTHLGFVLNAGAQSIRTHIQVSGPWPAAVTPASVSPALQAALTANAEKANPVQSSDGMTWLWALGAAFVGGLILNLMPCVFPILAIKVLGFSRQQPSGSPYGLATAYSAGVVLSMAALGGLMLALRAGGEQLGWGFQLQSPAFVSGLAILFTLIALNLLGLLNVGNLLPSSAAGLQLRHPAADAFLSGVLAVVVASPCTAPFMGASLGLALTLPAWQAMGIFIALGLGLALPFALLSSNPRLLDRLPKPGPWMDQLRHFMAFPMAATVLWLVWVVGHLNGVDASASLVALLLCLSLLCWALGLSGKSRWIFAGIAVFVGALALRAVGPVVLQPSESKLDSFATSPTASPWKPWSTQAVEDALASGQPVFVDFTAAWCITCQFNKQTTLSNAAVLSALSAKGVVLLRADWTRRDAAITQALMALGRSGVPVYALYAPNQPVKVLSEILSKEDLLAAVSTL